VVVFLRWQRCVSSGIDNLAASSLFLAAFCHRIYKNQPAEVFYGARSFMVPGSFFHSEACVTENKNNQPVKCFMVPRSFFHPGIWKLPYAAAARLILFFVFTERQQTPLQKNRHHREAAAVRFRKLVAVRIWKVVASGGWNATRMPPLPWLG